MTLRAKPSTLRDVAGFRIEPVACRRDNYAYLILGDTAQWVVDPTDFEPVWEKLEKDKPLLGILATHHHHDHVGGIQELCQATTKAHGQAPWVAGHASDRGRIPNQSEFIDAPRGRFIDSGLRVAGHPLMAAHIPGHTMGAIAWKFAEELFTGDTLFSAGCGRLFEGSPQDMFESFRTLMACPPQTRLWFGHEYTQANLDFARRTEPEHSAYERALRELRVPSCPSSVERELEINIFARAKDPAHFRELRSAKDRG